MQGPQIRHPVLGLVRPPSPSNIAVVDLSGPILGDRNGDRTFYNPRYTDSRKKTYPVSACIWECNVNQFNCAESGLQAAADAFCRHSQFYRAYPTQDKGWHYTKSGSTQGSKILHLYFKNGTFQTDECSYCKNCGWVFTYVTCNGSRTVMNE